MREKFRRRCRWSRSTPFITATAYSVFGNKDNGVRFRFDKSVDVLRFRTKPCWYTCVDALCIYLRTYFVSNNHLLDEKRLIMCIKRLAYARMNV